MTRIAVFGREGLASSVAALGFEPGDDGPVAVVDAEDDEAVARAAAISSSIPRIVVAPPSRHALLRALGTDASHIVASASPAELGPAITAMLPRPARAATRVVAVTGTRGGVGRTLLVTNLGRRLARSSRVAIIDATGSGAAAWWLAADAAPWSELEPLATELSAEHLAIIAREAAPGLRLVGGAGSAPSASIVVATIRAAVAAFDLVLVDAPPAFGDVCAAMRSLLDRALVLTYDDPVSLAILAAPSIVESDWIVASQFSARRVGDRDVFRTLPRDEHAVAAAFASRGAIGGRLGHAYDELAEILAIDAAR
jgi:hypothetical protein